MNNLKSFKRVILFTIVIICGIIYIFNSIKQSINEDDTKDIKFELEETTTYKIDFSNSYEVEEETKESKSLIKDVSYRKIVNINTADETELKSLPAVGEVLSKSIIEYRDKYGKFKTIEEIKNVSGIGNNLFRKIEHYITVE